MAHDPVRWRMLIGQVMRYGLVGGAVTVLQGAVYWLLSARAGWDPQLGNFAGYLAAVTAGFVAHGSFTFRGHDAQSAAPVRLARFVGVSLISLALNAFWVWLTVTALEAPLWAPLPFMAVVTPGLVFILNRQWVFR
jgi:putative flippase GtrA